MKAFHAYRVVTALLSAAALAAGAPVSAQQPDDDTTLPRSHRAYRYRAQAAAADELVKQLASSANDLNTLYQLSRLLSEPCDQVGWLTTQIELRMPFGSDDATRSSAEQLLTRVADLEQSQQTALRGCAERLDTLKQLLARIAEPPTPWELTDPAQLAARWTELGGLQNAELARQLTPGRQLTLFARGVSPSEVGLDGQAAWDRPRLIVDALAASGQLPEMWRLLLLRQTLGAAERESATWTELAFPVGDTFQIAWGLLDRSLGADAEDQGGATGRPNWADLAARFESGDYWAWAALARILEAADQQDPAPAIAAARTQWSKLAQVGSALGGATWPAAGGGEQSWLSRLERGELAGAGLLPLAPEYRSAQRAARRRIEQQFVQARNDPAQALRLIQLAKAADVGLTEDRFQPITLAELEGQLQTTIRGETALKVFVLLELIEVSGNAGQPSQFYAFRLSARDWRWNGGGFDAAVIGPTNTPAQLVQSALDASVTLTDLRILVAPDGPLDADWFAAERDHLLDRTADRARGWLCYLPTAAALNNPSWTLDQTLRLWYRTALGGSAETIGCYPAGREPAGVRARLHLAPNLRLHAASLGSLPNEIAQLRPSRRFVDQFKNHKETAAAAGRTLPVVLVFTGEQP